MLIRAQHIAKSPPLNIVVNSDTLRRVLSVTGLASIFYRLWSASAACFLASEAGSMLTAFWKATFASAR